MAMFRAWYHKLACTTAMVSKMMNGKTIVASMLVSPSSRRAAARIRAA
ncbi:hypothetical protein ACWERV_32665 [Streptomyces sp. NPDC004031]